MISNIYKGEHTCFLYPHHRWWPAIIKFPYSKVDNQLPTIARGKYHKFKRK